MPTVIQIKGYRFFFFSNEGKEPKHIHVESSGNYAKFWLIPVELAHNYGYNDREINRLHGLVEDNRDVLIGAWHEFFSNR